MLVYISSIIFISASFALLAYCFKQSRPTALQLNSKDAKSFMFDKYWQIEQMKASSEKEEARRLWRKECAALQQKLQPDMKELSVKVVD